MRTNSRRKVSQHGRANWLWDIKNHEKENTITALRVVEALRSKVGDGEYQAFPSAIDCPPAKA
jgi:hypothetical protein